LFYLTPQAKTVFCVHPYGVGGGEKKRKEKKRKEKKRKEKKRKVL